MKIALGGKMLAGKDYVCSKIIKMEPDYERRAFADKLKQMVFDNFGVRKEFINGREILQTYGKIGRLVDTLFWVKLALVNEPDNVVVTDMRFKNEANYLRKHGYKLVWIYASPETRAERGELKNESDISENDLDDYNFDVKINNNDVDEKFLEEQIRSILKNG